MCTIVSMPETQQNENVNSCMTVYTVHTIAVSRNPLLSCSYSQCIDLRTSWSLGKLRAREAEEDHG